MTEFGEMQKRDSWRLVIIRPFLVTLALMAIFVGCVLIVGDPMAIPTTSEGTVRRALESLTVPGAPVVHGTVSHGYDCDRHEPSAAKSTVRINGNRDHAELLVRRQVSRAGWLVAPMARDDDNSLLSLDPPQSDHDMLSASAKISPHRGATDVTITVWGQLGQKCGVD